MAKSEAPSPQGPRPREGGALSLPAENNGALPAEQARPPGVGPYSRVDWVNLTLKERVDKLAAAAGVRAGAVLEWLTARHLSELEERPGLLIEEKLRAQKAALLAQLAAIDAELGE